MLNGVMLIVANNPFMLSVIMQSVVILIVVMLSAVASCVWTLWACIAHYSSAICQIYKGQRLACDSVKTQHKIALQKRSCKRSFSISFHVIYDNDTSEWIPKENFFLVLLNLFFFVKEMLKPGIGCYQNIIWKFANLGIF
jgi:hypothetical protein